MFIVKENSKKGKGITAIQQIAKNEPVTTFEGSPIVYEQTIELGNKESFALQVSPKSYIFLDLPYRFFNHSCDPNCGLGPDLTLRAIRDISDGEELTYDYSTTMLEHHWQMQCKCGTSRCRKVVRDFITLPIELQRLYLELDIVQAFIRDAIQY